MKSKGRPRKINNSNNIAQSSGELTNIKQICDNAYPLYNIKHQLTQFDIYAEGKVVKKTLPNKLKKCKHAKINTNSHQFYTKKNNEVRRYVTDTLYVIRRLCLYTSGGNCALYKVDEEKHHKCQTLLNNHNNNNDDDGSDSDNSSSIDENGISVEQILEGLRKVTSDMLPINIITNNEYLAYILKYIITDKIKSNTFRFIPQETFCNIKRNCKVMIWRVFDSNNGQYTIDSGTLRNFHNNYTDSRILSYKKFHVYVEDLTAPKQEKKVTGGEEEEWRGEMMSIMAEEKEKKLRVKNNNNKKKENAFFVVKVIKDQKVPRIINIQTKTNNFAEVDWSGLSIKLTNVYLNEYLKKKND